MAKKLTDNQRRCEDCPCLITSNGKWCCDECFGQDIENIDDCPEGVTLADIEKLDEELKNQKLNLGAKSTEKKTKENKPKTIKVSSEKIELFDLIWEGLSNFYGENAKIEKQNKLIKVKINETEFKVDIIESRKPKK